MLRSLGLMVLFIWIPHYLSQFELEVVSNLISTGCSESSLENSIHLPQYISWCFRSRNFPANKIVIGFFFKFNFIMVLTPLCNIPFYLPPYTYYPPPIQSTLKKNVGVFASMLYVYYKFHMQCVNQQKVDKKEKKTVVLLRLRYDEEKIRVKNIYISNKHNNHSWILT